MPRVKRGVAARARHAKVLKVTKGQRGSKSKLFRRANEAMLASLKYATRDRRNRKRDMRQLWITRINAGARQHGMSYSRLIEGLRLAGVEVNRKVLADLAITDANSFRAVATARTPDPLKRRRIDEGCYAHTPVTTASASARSEPKKRDRYSEQRFVLEGLRLVREALHLKSPLCLFIRILLHSLGGCGAVGG